MKGYDVASGYMGWAFDRWMLFPTEDEYIHYMKGDFE